MASLILTREGAVTRGAGAFLFRENFDRRIVFGMAATVAGAVFLEWSGKPTPWKLSGPLAITGGSLRTTTRSVSVSDPPQIVKLKGLIVTRRHLTVARSARKSWQHEQIEPW